MIKFVSLKSCFSYLSMEVFSTVVVEISTAVFALLPQNENYSYDRCRKRNADNRSTQCCSFETESAELTLNYRAKFLEDRFKDLNVNVVVMTHNSRETASSLKLCGGWSEISAVHMWLMQFVQAREHTQTANDTEQLQGRTGCETTVSEHCIESTSYTPRRSLRNRHVAKQDCVAEEMMSSTVTKSKQIKGQQLKEDNLQTKKSKMLQINVSESKSEIAEKATEMLESYANCNISKDKAPVVVLSDEQSTTASSVFDTDISSDVQVYCTESAEAGSEVRQQSVSIDESVQNSTLKELKCDSCDYVTRKQRNLHMHVARTHGDRSFVCPTCNRTFAIAKDLNHHLKSHTEQYCCEHCGQTLKSKYAVALHVARIHNGVAPRPVKRYLCTLCGKMCRNKTDYTVHRNKEHTGVRPFHCDVCGASFFSRSNLRAHRQVLFNVMKFTILCRNILPSTTNLKFAK